MGGDGEPDTERDPLLEAAVAAAEDAAALHRRELGRLDPAAWSEKGTSDFVTEVDREAERIIVRHLRERFPRHAIVAEEGTSDAAPEPAVDPAEEGPGAGGGPVRWLVDPLDGTTNWLHGYPAYSVSLAALDADGLRVGVVVDSARGERWEAVRGGGSRRNGEPIRVSTVDEPRLALLGTGFPFKSTDLLPLYLPMLDRALRSTSGVRRAGSAALDLCHLACGWLDGFWELWLQPWDVAAGTLIVREAGGWFGPFEPDFVGRPRREASGAGEADGRDAGERDPGIRQLEEAVDGARDFLGWCRGEGAGDRPLRGGAYLGANGRLREALARILSGSTHPPAR